MGSRSSQPGSSALLAGVIPELAGRQATGNDEKCEE